MTVFRLCKDKFRMVLSGHGAELHAGRWNSKGLPMLYTSESRALAFAEVFIHLPSGIIPIDYYLVSILIPDHEGIIYLKDEDLPSDWRSYPFSDSTQKIGDQFLQGSEHLVLRVPSAIVPGDHNFLLNPAHPRIKEVKIIHVEPFEFDSRFALR